MRWHAAGLALALLFAPAVQAAGTAQLSSGFANPQEDMRYHSLLRNLRCLVCQNESLQDSQADLAKDLRRVVRAQMRAGKSDREIVRYLVARYGDYVLYRPPFMGATYVLWVGPFVVLAAGLLVLMLALRRRRRAPEETLNQEQRRRLSEFLGPNEDHS
ncbi:MAG: cytochrome c-type biogenesis protein CcmH [Gammaproteobacteria bacterium]|jgi:cytochrome c-type biogenesis protein CcmH